VPLDAALPTLTPDDLMGGERPAGKHVVLFDDDHYYMGGVLAELLASEGHEVTVVTPEGRVSQWTENTMEQHRIQRRLLEMGVTAVTAQTLAGAGADSARISCVYTDREQELGCDALVLVTARLPQDAVYLELKRLVAESGAAMRVRAVGDAWSPGTIAAAVWDGHRYAEELDGPDEFDTPPFRREVVELAPDDVSAPVS
jgi:dimethylamine/trimethylamine dehydrogenase